MWARKTRTDRRTVFILMRWNAIKQSGRNAGRQWGRNATDVHQSKNSAGSARSLINAEIFYNSVGAAVDMKLFVNAADVGVKGSHADVHFRGNLFVGKTFGQLFQHF